jgi:hypothetical protein
MGPDDIRANYLATGTGETPADHEQLDLIRGVLAESPIWEEQPEGVVEGLLATIAREGQPSEADVAAPQPRRPWLMAAGAVAAISLLVIGIASLSDQPTTETVVAMTGTELAPAAGGVAALRPTPSGWYIRLDVSGLPAAPEGTYYEGWVWSDDNEGVSIGTFHLRSGDDPVVLWSGVSVVDYPAIWVTLQDEGAGAEASDRIMMKGRVDELVTS